MVGLVRGWLLLALPFIAGIAGVQMGGEERFSREALTPQERALLEEEVALHSKNVCVAYILLLLAGPLGLHRFYLREIRWGIGFALTFGFLFIGVLVDALRLEGKVKRYNARVEKEALERILALRGRGRGGP